MQELFEYRDGSEKTAEGARSFIHVLPTKKIHDDREYYGYCDLELWSAIGYRSYIQPEPWLR